MLTYLTSGRNGLNLERAFFKKRVLLLSVSKFIAYMSANIIPILWRPDAELIIYHRSEINIYCVLSIYSFGLKISNNIIALGLDDNLVSQDCQGEVGWRGWGGRKDEERS